MAIEAAVQALPVPVIVKEVGAGIQAQLVKRLFDVGVRAVDVAGLGGTNWARIEAARRLDGSVTMFEPFMDWGIPTLDCLLQASKACPDHCLIASGGVRHGLDAAKALWAGASMVSGNGFDLPVLAATGFVGLLLEVVASQSLGCELRLHPGEEVGLHL